jgi:DNA replication protein DnaC
VSPPSVYDLDGMLRRLHLPTVRPCYGELAMRAETEGMSYHTYLETLIVEKLAHRAETRITRAVRKACFRMLRMIDDFNFTFQTALKRQMFGRSLGAELVSEGKSAIFSGPSGTGKSHLSIAIAYHRALQHGYDARFIGADTLISELLRVASKGRLERALESYLQPHVLVLDELGYLCHAPDTANVLYRVANEQYLQRKSMVLTTNKPLAALDDVLHDGDLAEAILDWLLERGVHFTFRGRSYRTRHLAEEKSSPRYTIAG